jgi:ribosomal protein L32
MTTNSRQNPVHRLPDWRTTLPMAQSCPRCGARTRSGRSCRSPAMPNGKCRMHGGCSTGPTAAGIERIRQARTIHGQYSAEMTELRRMVAVLRREARRAITAVR